MRTTVLILMGLSVFFACSGGGGRKESIPDSVAVQVVNGAGLPVAGATVFLVPSGDIDGSPMDGLQVLDGTAENRDEPIEDAVAAFGASMAQAVTGADGRATLTGVGLGRYFWFVQPTDGEHLPGALGGRRAIDADTVLGTTVQLHVTSQPSPAATYIGSTSCISCHQSYASQGTHAHRLGFTRPGAPSALQDHSRYPEFFQGQAEFLPAATFQGGTPVWLSDFNPARGFDKFVATLSDPTPEGRTVYVKAWLWQDTATNIYRITLENIIGGGNQTMELEVPLTYGGAVFKQRNLVRVMGRPGLFPFLQIQPEGEESRFDRTRKVHRDYHMDWFWNDGTQSLVNPPLNRSFDANCTACHSTGFTRFQDAASGEWLSSAVTDPGGAFDIDGDGQPNEINTGCEVCHGPGSDHAAWASNPANQGQASRFIVQPERLSPSREMLICGRCHDRVQGNGSIINDEPLDSQNRFPPVGIKRSDYLASYVSRNGPGTGDFWSDAVHSKSHHQQYSDLLKSTMHRNGRIITTCSDCHDSHGDGPFRHHLVENPDDANGALCASCHRDDLFEHIAVQTGFTHAGNQTTCTKCHMSETAKTGAGRYGILLGAPTGQAGDVNVTYFENDITSHLFGAIPRKQHPDVAGVQPGSAMPIPYTNSCGAVCHQAAIIPFLAPVGAPLVVAPGESVPAGEPDDGAAMVPLARPEDQR